MSEKLGGSWLAVKGAWVRFTRALSRSPVRLLSCLTGFVSGLLCNGSSTNSWCFAAG